MHDEFDELSGPLTSTIGAIGCGVGKSIGLNHEGAKLFSAAGQLLTTPALRNGAPHNGVQNSHKTVPAHTGKIRLIGGIPAPALSKNK